MLRIFNEYIFCLPQGTLTQLNFALDDHLKWRRGTNPNYMYIKKTVFYDSPPHRKKR